MPRYRAARNGLWQGGLIPLESHHYDKLDARLHQDFWKRAGSLLLPELQEDVESWREEFGLPSKGLNAREPERFFAWRKQQHQQAIEETAQQFFPRLGLPTFYQVAWRAWLIWNEVIWLDEFKVQVGGIDFEQDHDEWIEVRLYPTTRKQDLLDARDKIEEASKSLFGQSPRRKRVQHNLLRDIDLYRWVRQEGWNASQAAHYWNQQRLDQYNDDFADLIARGMDPHEAERHLETQYADPALDAGTVRAAVARLERELRT